MELGGNIELIGFSEHSSGDLIVIKKIVGNFTKDLSDRLAGFDSITITLKEVHREQEVNVYEIEGCVETSGDDIIATSKDANLYFALDEVLKQLKEQT